MGDVVYTKLAIFGKKPKTELCDAKYDGRINVLDVIQTKLIILGKEKELTLIDTGDRIVTVNKPIKRIITLGTFTSFSAEVIRIFGEQDRIVGITSGDKDRTTYFPELSKLPPVSSKDLEGIVSLHPDLVITLESYAAGLDEQLPDDARITIVGLDLYKPKTLVEEMNKLGYILGKEGKKSYYVNDFHDKYINLIKARIEKVSEEERPKVFFSARSLDAFKTYGGKAGIPQMIDIAGGKCLYADIDQHCFAVDPEDLVVKNPDIILRWFLSATEVGYGVDDPSKIKVEWEKVMHLPKLAYVSAVKNGNVYIIDKELAIGPDYPIAVAYWAKWFYPELFEDLDPQAIHQEFIDRFCPGLDYDVKEHGVFVYPPLTS
jgi:iron complex transport system substrate-binding protein